MAGILYAEPSRDIVTGLWMTYFSQVTHRHVTMVQVGDDGLGTELVHPWVGLGIVT